MTLQVGLAVLSWNQCIAYWYSVQFLLYYSMLQYTANPTILQYVTVYSQSHYIIVCYSIQPIPPYYSTLIGTNQCIAYRYSVQFFSDVAPHFCQHMIHQVIWPSPGTLRVSVLWEVGGWGRDPKKCTGRDWGMGSSTINERYAPLLSTIYNGA